MLSGDVLDVYVYRQIGTNLVVPGGARTIEAKGRLIIPGMAAYSGYNVMNIITNANIIYIA